MNEWQFTSDVAKWITLILDKNTDLPFGEAYCEGQSPNSAKRRDLTIKDRNGRVVLTGEVKLPGRRDGATPYNNKVVTDARFKAQHAQASFFFTWNVNECVLWETEASTVHPRPDYKRWQVTNIHDSKSLEYPDIQAQIKKWLAIFLHDAADILRGASIIEKKSPDEKFIDALEAALGTPIALTLNSLFEQYRRQTPRRDIDDWMRDELGFIIVTDPEGIRTNLENASKHACYALANKLVFYEALLKRYGASLPSLSVPDHITAADPLRTHLEGFFAHAKVVTHDYETVFGENALGLGSRVPFYNDGVVDFWRAFVDEIHDFDFSRLDYEVIGNIFERLISPEERHKFGQFYTRVEVVDLINSFAIRTGEEQVMDPACGGGTFLVRAYARKRELAPHRSHAQRLHDLYGVDISRFATHLTTINLATRDLIDDENYPQVARSDFFDVKPHSTIFSLPRGVTASGLGNIQRRDVQIPLLDAVVGNPPYIRQEEIPKSSKSKSIQPGTKEYYRLIAKQNGAKLSARSDIHCYFWPHSISFLKENGYLCLLTSSQWLDTDYGFKLQAWILRNFEIVAVLESLDEPWFVGARVVTTVTVLRRQPDAKKRMENMVRFVQLHQPMAKILAHDGTTAGAMLSADRFRDELLTLTENTRNARYRARLIQQRDLWMEGVRLGVAMGKAEAPADNDVNPQPGEFYGGKWGVYLRAPDLWFDLLDHFHNRVIPFGELTEIRRGITTGKDSFFYPRDATQEALKVTDFDEFQTRFGVERAEVTNGDVKIVRCGEGYEEMRSIESHFLEPEVHSLMEINGYIVKSEDCGRMILLIPTNEVPPDSYAQSYIDWGEEQEFNQGSTVRGRMTDDRAWYDRTGHRRGSVFWPKAQQYRHSAPLNEQNLQCNCNLYDVYLPDGIEPELLAGRLNSTFVGLSKFQYGRPVGVEGALKTEVIDVNIMRVPDPRLATETQRKRVIKAFRTMKHRDILGFLSERRLRRMNYIDKGKEVELNNLSDETELTQPDRRELDDAILELLGVGSATERTKILDTLYEYLADFFEYTRQKEEKAIQNKKRAKRRKVTRPADIAREILAVVEREYGTLLRTYDDFLDLSKPFDTYEIPAEGNPEPLDDLFHRHAVRFVNRKAKASAIVETRDDIQRKLLMLVVENGTRGFVRIPLDDNVTQHIHNRYDSFLTRRMDTLRTLVEERASDPELQEKIYLDLMKRVLSRKKSS